MPRRTGHGNATRVLYQGEDFDSITESKFWPMLQALAEIGAIRNLVRQPQYTLIPTCRTWDGATQKKITYTLDYGYEEQDADGTWHAVGVDVKGGKWVKTKRGRVYKPLTTPASELRMKLLRWRYPELRFQLWTERDLPTLRRTGG